GGQEVRRLVTMNCVPTYASMNVVNECSRLVNEESGRAIIRRMCKLRVLISFIALLRVCLFGGSAHCQAPSDSPKWHVKKLALEVSDEFLHNDIYIMDPSGSKPRRLVEGISPAWSPDGQKIAYGTRDGGRFGQIHVINADGSNRKQLTRVRDG